MHSMKENTLNKGYYIFTNKTYISTYPRFCYRFRGPGPEGKGDFRSGPSIVKEQDLKDFDKIINKSGGWDESQMDMDYSQKMVFRCLSKKF